MTIEDLAGMIKNGFDENTEQHEKIFKRFDNIDRKLENVVH